MTPLSFSLDCSDEPFPNFADFSEKEALPHVGQEQKSPTEMSSEELSAYILLCEKRFVSAHLRGDIVAEEQAWDDETAALIEQRNRN